MRVFLIAVSLLGCAHSAHACNGSADVLSLEDWHIEKVDGFISGVDITVDLKSHAKMPFRMIDASYILEDVLGHHISGFKINPDIKAKPGETVSTTNGYMGSGLDRVINMDRSDITITTCVRALVYEDGSKETFN